jgi:hypothetical protein
VRLAGPGGSGHNGRVSNPIRKDELEGAIAARRELGPAYEDEILDSFLARVEQRLVGQPPSEKALKARRDHQKEMILGAMGIAVPLFVVAAIFTGLAGIIVVAAMVSVVAVVVGRTT